MFFSSRSLLALGFSLAAGCAGSGLETKTASSADSAGYALRYVDGLGAATRTFAADKQRAHDLTSGLPARARELRGGNEPEFLQRVVEESDQAGRGESYARTQQDERALRAFWEDERGPLSARVSAATQTAVHQTGCTQQVELGGSVQHALRDGIDKQLERRLRAANEGQRTLEQHKAKLAPNTLPALQRLSDEIALASHLVHVALVNDVHELDRLLGERRDVNDTLGRMLDEERAIQADPQKPSEQRASQERVVQIENSRAALAPRVQEAEAALRDREEQLRAAQKEYANTIEAIKASFGEPGKAPTKPAGAAVKP